MKINEILAAIVRQMQHISKPAQNFIVELCLCMLSLKGRYNFANMSRWSHLSERTFRRHFSKCFDFCSFNQLFIDIFFKSTVFIAAIDASFISKSGSKTYGLAKFWSGCMQKSLKGLEISALALVSVSHRQAFTISVSQTQPPAKCNTAIDQAISQFGQLASWLLSKTKYLTADGNYCKTKFIDAVYHSGMHLITKLRQDCHMRLTAGQVQHEQRGTTATTTFGLNADGAPTSCPGNGIYYAKLEWAGPNKTRTVLLPY